MYSITLEINQRCNLRCKYCYLGEKSGAKMGIETANKAIDFAFEKCKPHKDKVLWFDFVGGEPLLDFEMIKNLIAYIEKKNESYNYKLLYSTTTNGTIFNQEILEYLIEKNFSLKISIDGRKEINDLNRVTAAGEGTFDKIMQNLKYIKEYEKRTDKLVQVTNVITLNNYKHYFDILSFLTNELGLRYIDTAIDLEVKWTDEQIAELQEEIQKSFDYFIQKAKQKKGFFWEFADKVVHFKNERKKFYACGGGIIINYIRTDGGIYACPGNLDTSVELGNVNTGINNNKMKKLINFNRIKNESCEACEISTFCVEQSCIMQNLAGTGDINTPLKILCRMRKLMFKIYQDNENIISRLVM